MNSQKLIALSLLLLPVLGIPFVAHTSVVQQQPTDDKPQTEQPVDPRFVQMVKLKERNQRDARYASRMKAKFKNDPKTLNTARDMYDRAKDKFDGWLTALGLAIVHKQEKELQNDQFKQVTIEANKAATDFEVYAERLTRVEEANPLTGESAMASLRSAEQSRNVAFAGEPSATAAAAGAPASPILGVAQLIVGIAVEVYKQHQAIKQAKRQALVDDMKAQISWKEWGDIKPDPDTEALPKPKPSPSASASPSPADKPSPKPKPTASP